MSPDPRVQLEAWLRYADDLGLQPFYRHRNTPGVVPSPEEGSPAGRKAPQAASRPAKGSAPAPTSPLPSSATPPRAAPVAGGPSLFEVIERVENDSLERIRADLGDCTRCKLHTGRTHIVFGDGHPQAELVFVGEGPGHDEDLKGLPFVGRAGKLLTQMIEAMTLKREQVYICNVVKCRPPENRTPEKDEVATCSPFLLRQLAVIQPKVIVCLGAVAAQMLLATPKGISHYRGQWFDFRGARLMATYHPAYLLRNPAAKSDVWEDLKKVMGVLGLKVPRRMKV